MFLKPQVPQNHTLTAHTAGSSLARRDDAPAACACHHAPGRVQPATPVRRSLPTVGTGAIAVVLIGGVVLTALLTAVAVSAISVAVAAVVLRSLLRSQRQR